MAHQNYRHGDGREQVVGEGQRRMPQARISNLMEGPTQWGLDGENGVYRAQRWSRVAAGDGDACAIDCSGALIPEEDTPVGGKGLHWEKGSLGGGGPTAPG